MVKRREIWGVVLGLGLGLGLGGCKAKATEAPAGPVMVVVRMEVAAAKDANGGRPFHVIARGVTREGFVEDDYAEVARLVVAPDESVVGDVVVFPGEKYVVDLEFEEAPEGVGVYGLVTEASGDGWKVFVEGGREFAVFIEGDRLSKGV